MKNVLATTATSLVLIGSAAADPFSRIVPAGRTSVVYTYKPWDWSCHSTFAVAKLTAKPQHGSVSHHIISSTIPDFNRISGRTTPCRGTPVTGFVVTYTPAPGFHGTDAFILDVDYPTPQAHKTDVFTIQVE